MSIREELNMKMNYDNFSNIMIEKATLINHKAKEENAFELENFLYNESSYPTINLGKVVMEEDILNNNFYKETVYIDNIEVNYYICNEDNCILIYEDPNNDGNVIMQYTNNFSSLKESINPNNLNKNYNSNINSILEQSNTFLGSDGYILNENASMILENNKEKNIIYDNPFLNSYSVKLLNEKYNEISKDNHDDELVLTEEVINGNLQPIISVINPVEEKIKKVMQVGYKEIYPKHFTMIIK